MILKLLAQRVKLLFYDTSELILNIDVVYINQLNITVVLLLWYW